MGTDASFIRRRTSALNATAEKVEYDCVDIRLESGARNVLNAIQGLMNIWLTGSDVIGTLKLSEQFAK